MKYKILLTGNNKTLIDDLFAKSSEHFEFQNTSSRYEDIICHIKYFQPDGFLYCINHELPESFRRMSDLKHAPETGGTAFFAIGTRAECSAYTRTAPDVVDLVLEKPITLSALEEKILIYFSSIGRTPSVPSEPVAPVPIPVKQQQAVDNMVQAFSQTQPGSTAQTFNPRGGQVPPTGQPQPSVMSQIPKQIPVSGISQAAGQMQTPDTPQATGQMQVPNAPQTSEQLQTYSAAQAANGFSTQPAANQTAQAPVDAAKPAAAAQNAPANDADDLLLALTNEIGEAAKILEAVEDMDLNELTDDTPSSRKHILVVDDDSRMLKIIKRHLADKYDVATALNGKVALKFLENKRTDLILLDYEMPLESGPAVLKKLRDNPMTQDIPVIFLTGISERNKIEKALALKPQGYLLKPIDHIKLLSTISKFVD